MQRNNFCTRHSFTLSTFKKSIMKRLFRNLAIAFFLSVGIISNACTTSLSSEIGQELRNLKDFTGISLSISADVYLTQGNEYSVNIEADKDILDKIETEVEGGILKISTVRGFSIGWNNAKIKIHVTMPEIQKLSIAGSGDIKAVTSITANNLSTSISGSGDISIPDLSVKTLTANISGSGDINILGKGTAKDASIKVTGSGDITLKGIEFKDGEVTITGSGNAYLVVTENLNARVVGSGDIVYSGNPLIDAKVTGSGRIQANSL